MGETSMGSTVSNISGAQLARHKVVHEQCAPLMKWFAQVERNVQQDRVVDRHAEDLSGLYVFAAATLRAMVLEAASDTWDDPMGEGETENMLFAEIGDPAPTSFDYEVHVSEDGKEMEGVGEREHRYTIAVKRVGEIMDVVVSDREGFRTALRKVLDRVAERSPTQAIARARRIRARMIRPEDDLAVANVVSITQAKRGKRAAPPAQSEFDLLSLAN